MKQHSHCAQRPSVRGGDSILPYCAIGALAFLVGLAGSPAYADEPAILNETALRPAMSVQQRNEVQLFATPGVLAVGVGMLTGTKTPAIHVYINSAAPAVSAGAMPAHLEGVPVEIIETDEFKALDGPPGTNHRLTYARPVPMGVSTSNVNGIFAGTLGIRVHHIGQPSSIGYVTNNHVGAASGPNLCPTQLNPANLAAFGVDQCQAGRLDAAGNACVAPRIGDLTQIVPIVMGQQFANVVDAVFVQSTRSLVNKFILDIGNPSPTVQAPAVNLAVRKSGRTTGFTTGTLQTINTTVNVGYGAACGVARFIGQMLITPGSFSASGDSGSLILGSVDGSGRRRPVGLLFAGSSTITIANRISDVLGALNVQIDTL